jgi:hypothetical protein
MWEALNFRVSFVCSYIGTGNNFILGAVANRNVEINRIVFRRCIHDAFEGIICRKRHEGVISSRIVISRAYIGDAATCEKTYD